MRSISTGLASIAAALTALGISFGSASVAHAATCNVNFNDRTALRNANESLTFLYAPYYNQACAGGPVQVAESNFGVVINHFHLMYENSCVRCLVTSGGVTEFGLDLACATSAPHATGCNAIDKSLYPRYAASMDHGQAIILTSPGASNYCVSNGCLPTVGKPFRPQSIRVRDGSPVDVFVTALFPNSFTVQTPGGPVTITVPSRATWVIRNLSVGTWNISAFGNVDQLWVTGSASSALNFNFDDIVIDI